MKKIMQDIVSKEWGLKETHELEVPTTKSEMLAELKKTEEEWQASNLKHGLMKCQTNQMDAIRNPMIARAKKARAEAYKAIADACTDETKLQSAAKTLGVAPEVLRELANIKL